MPTRQINTLEAIRAYELGEPKATLTNKQEEMKERYELAFHYLYTYRQVSQVAHKLRGDYGYSIFTAYQDIEAAMELYGNPVASNREAMRFMNTENQNRLLQLVELEIKKKKDTGADFIAEIETASRINERIAKVNRLGEEDVDAFDPTKIERTQVFIINMQPDVMERYEDVIDIPVETVELPQNASA